MSATPAGREPAAGAPVMDVERLVSMANQIGDFFAAYPAGQREEGVRNHLRNYWDPRMRAALLAHMAATGGEGLHAHVLAGARLLDHAARERAAYAGPPRADTAGMSSAGE